MTTTKVLLGLLALILIVGVVWYTLGNRPSVPSSTTATTTAQNVTSTSAGSDQAGTVSTGGTVTATVTGGPSIKSVPTTITYTDKGFSPQSVSVPAGTPITFVNNSSESMWIASDPHPTHTGYDGTSGGQHCAGGAPISSNVFDECTAVSAGGTFTFSPTKIGRWGYHNHADHQMIGSITITASK